MSTLDRFRIDNGVAIVTDAGAGFGTVIARVLAESGADVTLGTTNDWCTEAVEAVESAGRKAVQLRTDVRDLQDCHRLVEAAADLGPVRALVNNAGVGSGTQSPRLRPEQFRSVLDVNLVGTYQMSQAACEVMPEGGAVVNISSVLGLVALGLPHSAYTASTSGLFGLTRDLAAQWSGSRQIRVNVIAPGYFPDEMDSSCPETHLDWQLADRPIPRPGSGEELAAAVLFLACPASSYITGTTLVVDGGVTIS